MAEWECQTATAIVGIHLESLGFNRQPAGASSIFYHAGYTSQAARLIVTVLPKAEQ